MRNKLKFLIGISLKRKIKSKWFIIANIVLAIVIIGLINIDTIINLFGGDFNKKRTIYVIDNVGAFNNFKEVLSKSALISYEKEEDTFNIVLADKSLDELKNEYEKETKEKEFWIVKFDKNDELVFDATVISKSFIDTIDYQLLYSAINNTKVMLATLELNLSNEDINKLFTNIEVSRVILDEESKTEEEKVKSVFTTVFPVVVLPFFFLSIMLVQNIGSEVNDEKTTRGMEIIISSVSPKKHFFAKIIAGNLFILIQSLLLLIFAIIGIIIRKNTGIAIQTGTFNLANITSDLLSPDIISHLASIIPALLILMILTFIGYSLLAGILASMTTNAEDFQHIQTPIMMISLLGYYLSIMAGLFKGALFLKVFSFFPFISAILSPSLLVLGDIGVVHFIISTFIMILVDYLLIKYGLRIYKVGILNYSSKDLWKKMFKALKTK